MQKRTQRKRMWLVIAGTEPLPAIRQSQHWASMVGMGC